MPTDALFHAGDGERRSPAGLQRPRRSGLLGLALTLVVLLCALLAPVAEAATEASGKRTNGEVIANCSSITFKFFGFPNLPNNTVTEMVTVHHELVYTGKFTFNGSSGENTIPVSVPPGLGQIDGKATWNTNGFKSSYDISLALNCSDPGFKIEKEQEV